MTWGLYETGGYISSRVDKVIRGKSARLVDTFTNKQDAINTAKRYRKRLSPGEKKYYKFGYTIWKVKG